MMLHAGRLGAGVLHKVQGVVSCPKRLTFDGHVFASKIIPKIPFSASNYCHREIRF